MMRGRYCHVDQSRKRRLGFLGLGAPPNGTNITNSTYILDGLTFPLYSISLLNLTSAFVCCG